MCEEARKGASRSFLLAHSLIAEVIRVLLDLFKNSRHLLSMERDMPTRHTHHHWQGWQHVYLPFRRVESDAQMEISGGLAGNTAASTFWARPEHGLLRKRVHR